jgi:lipopolysaccharide assembly protein A
MQIVRTIVWVLLLIVLLIFSINNWNPVEVKIWEGLVLETKIPALVVISVLLGLLPMWLLHRITAYSARRKISSLESAVRTVPVAPSEPVAEPVVVPDRTAESPGPLKSE